MWPPKRASDSAVLVRARDAGWGIRAENGTVIFSPPSTGNRSNAEIEQDRKEIARAAASVAGKIFGWCYSGCK